MKISFDDARMTELANAAVEQALGPDAAKSVKVEANGGNMTVSFTDGAGKVHGSGPIELEPADGGILSDPAAIERLMAKLPSEFRVDWTKVDSFLTNARNGLLGPDGAPPVPDSPTDGGPQGPGDDAPPSGPDFPVNDLYKTIFSLMQLMLKANKTMKDAAAAARNSALASEVQAIENQAAKEEEAARTGLITSMCVLTIQLVVDGACKYKEIKSDVKAAKELTKQNVDLNKSLLDNTKLIDQPGHAHDAMLKLAEDVDPVAIQELAAEVGGLKVDGTTGEPLDGSAAAHLDWLKTQNEGAVQAHGADARTVDTGVMEERSQLEGAIAERAACEAKQIEAPAQDGGKYKFDGAEYDTKEKAEAAKSGKLAALDEKIETHREALVSKMDAAVDRIRTKLNAAQNALAEAETDGSWSDARVNELKAEVKAQRSNLLYANAVRTNVLANPVSSGGRSVNLISAEQAGLRVLVLSF